MSRYQVELNTGETINVPTDKARDAYEFISQYGLQAVLRRAKRTRAFQSAVRESDAHIRAIICPNGDRVTQF